MSIEFITGIKTRGEFEKSLVYLERSRNLDWRQNGENNWYAIRGSWKNPDLESVVCGVLCGDDKESDIVHLRANKSEGNLRIDTLTGRVSVMRDFVDGDLFLGVHLYNIGSEVKVLGSRVDFTLKKIPDLYTIEQRYGKKV